MSGKIDPKALAEQVKLARLSFEAWPDWMKMVAYFAVASNKEPPELTGGHEVEKLHAEIARLKAELAEAAMCIHNGGLEP